MASTSQAAGERVSTLPDVLLALFLVLPALLLGWPGEFGPLHGVFAATEWTATGFAVLFALPVVVTLLARRSEALELDLAHLAIAGLFVTFGWALCRPSFGAISDPVGRGSAMSAFLLILLFAVGAMRLGERGRAVLSWGSCVVTCVLLTPALWSGENGLSGALGNSGELSGAALPGALVGAFAALQPKTRAAFRFALLVAPALFVLHAALAPSYVGALAFVVVLTLGVFAARLRGEKRSAVALALGVCLTVICVIAFAVSRRAPSDESSFQSAEPSAASVASPDLGGFTVRAMIWKSTLQMIAARPFIGHGPGQYSVHFPPYRDAREIEASSYGREAGVETEVEHPHQDLLVVAAELGLFGLLGWLLFLGAAVVACWRSLRLGMLESALAAGGLGLILHAMANATLTANPAAATIGAACLGAGLQTARSSEARRSWFLPLVLAAWVLTVLPHSWNAVQHGRAIARLASGEPSATTQIDAWEDALDAFPESSVALSARARLAEALNQTPGSIQKLWRKAVEIRPHRIEALIQLGIRRALAGDLEEASEHFGHAHEVDPGHPVAAKNLARVLFRLGRCDEGDTLLEGLHRQGRPVELLWLKSLAVDVLKRCDVDGATRLYERAEAADELHDLQSGDYAWARSGVLLNEKNEGDADAWATHAHRLWAAEHLAAGRAKDAVRSFRQAVRIARDHAPPEGPPTLLREYAEALVEAGRDEEAREVLDRIAGE